jgi:hypothetical protein
MDCLATQKRRCQLSPSKALHQGAWTSIFGNLNDLASAELTRAAVNAFISSISENV